MVVNSDSSVPSSVPASGGSVRRVRTVLLLALVLAVLLAFLPGLSGGGASAVSAQVWQWPTGKPRRVVADFDPPSAPWLAGNRGVVLEAVPGEVVVSPAAGRVSVAGRIVDRDVVVIMHDHRRSTFEPVKALVSVGDFVNAGQPIGVVDRGPNGPLHWGVKVGPAQYVDPLRQLCGPIVLKPWDGPAGR